MDSVLLATPADATATEKRHDDHRHKAELIDHYARIAHERGVQIDVDPDGTVHINSEAGVQKRKKHRSPSERAKSAKRGNDHACAYAYRRKHGHDPPADRGRAEESAISTPAVVEEVAAAQQGTAAEEEAAPEDEAAAAADAAEAATIETKINSIVAMGKAPKRRAKKAAENKRLAVEAVADTTRRHAASATSDKGVKKKSGVDGTSAKHMHKDKELEKVVRRLCADGEERARVRNMVRSAWETRLCEGGEWRGRRVWAERDETRRVRVRGHLF